MLKYLMLSCLVASALWLIPSARGDSFEQFSVTGFLDGPPSDTISGEFVVDETTDTVASVDISVVSINLPQGTAQLWFGNAEVFQGSENPNVLRFEAFDSLGDQLDSAVIFPGNTGTFAGYAGGPLCGVDPLCEDNENGGIDGSAFISPSDGAQDHETLRSGSIIDDGPVASVAEPGTLTLLVDGLICLCLPFLYRRRSQLKIALGR